MGDTTTLTLDTNTLELARRGMLETAATDLGRASGMLEELAGDLWPMRANKVGDAQATVELVRESLAGSMGSGSGRRMAALTATTALASSTLPSKWTGKRRSMRPTPAA